LHATERNLAPAVIDLEEQSAAGLGRIDRLEDNHVGGELDLASGIARRLVQVEDNGIAAILRIHLEVSGPGEPLVGASCAEGVAPGHHFPLRHFEPGKPRIYGRRCTERGGQCECVDELL
jgi:hypothetical protein